MSSTPIDRNPDLLRLREEGFNVSMSRTGFFLMRDVPYVNGKGEIVYGVLATALELAGDRTIPPTDHTTKWTGDYPCDASGTELEAMRQTTSDLDLGNDLKAKFSFSRKPLQGYKDYYEKMTTYVAILGQPVAKLDPAVTARTRRVVEPEPADSPFNYLDTASARAEISAITDKFRDEVVGFVGLGGTGAYAFDQVAKCPVKAIHLFDGDQFLTHNAFRAPGAASIADLRAQPYKVDYFAKIYSNMHRGIVPHPYAIDESNVHELKAMTFVFLCMEGGKAKKVIVETLEAAGIPFVDVGMGLYAKNGKVGGILRSVLSLPDKREAARNRISLVADNRENAYDQNIQIADLNAINACLAVIAWKKARGFYFNAGDERFVSYTIGSSLWVKGDSREQTDDDAP